MKKRIFPFDESLFKKSPKMNPMKGHIIALIMSALIFMAAFYLYLPVLNIKDQGSVIFIVFFLFLYGFLDAILCAKFTFVFKAASSIAVFMAGAMIVLSFASAEFFHAAALQKQITITDTNEFTKDFGTISIDKIPVVDRDVAVVMGDKKLGEIQGLGSQYSIDDIYTLVAAKENIYRVAPLEYQDFFKWLQNRDQGIPGYIRVNVNDPTDVDLVMLADGIKISPSGYFGDNLFRFVRFAYPTAMIRGYSFEIDDNNHPFWVLSVYEPKVGFYGGFDATGAIVVDAVTGDSKRYNMDDVPAWVDRVQPSEFALTQIDNWGYYVHGFFNTIIGQKDMLQTTDGYNYVSVDGNTHIFSGMTSVGSDKSIVGFALIDLRTKAAKFYRIGGADEYAAMNSAQGQVQHLGYQASFPVIVNIGGTPSYFVSLKDREGLVKQYAFVAVQNYSYVGVGETVKEAQAKYLSLLSSSGIQTQEPPKETDIIQGEIASIASAIVEGNTVYYFTITGQDSLFTASIQLSSELTFASAGDQVAIEVMKSDSKVKSVVKFDHLGYDFE